MTLDTRTRALISAVQPVEQMRRNRQKNEDRNDAKARALAMQKRAAKEDARRERREVWNDLRELREFARREAKRGRFTLPEPVRGSGTRSCPVCGTPQLATAFTKEKYVCDGCSSQVGGLTEALQALRTARARARKPVMEQFKPSI